MIARVGGDPALTLELLTAYPDDREPSADDCLCQAPDVLGDARRMEGDPRYAGRALRPRGPRRRRGDWLQYWFWLYYNPKNLFGFGKHEGDWEMIQIGLGADGRPEELAYAQHDSGEARKAAEVEWVERDGEQHPVVYVAPLSHASYFEAGTHPYPIGIDHPYGDGPEAWLPVERFGDWVTGPGGWGNSRAGDRDPDRKRAAESLAPGLEVEEPGRVSAQDGPAQVPRAPRPAALPVGKPLLPEAAAAQRARWRAGAASSTTGWRTPA